MTTFLLGYATGVLTVLAAGYGAWRIITRRGPY